MDPLLLVAPLSVAAGVNLYLTVFLTGLVVRFDWAAEQLPESLDVLGSWPVLAVAALLTTVEFFADKIPYLDNAWDLVHTFIRPAGAMLIALNVLPEGDQATTVSLTLLAGAGALTSHSSKAGARALVNTSPEPVSNIVVSMLEDLSVVGLMMLAFRYPWIAAGVAALLIVLLLLFLVWLVRFARRAFGGLRGFLRRRNRPPNPARAVNPGV
ncbi:MAG: DUF4126 domain-containing protein [Actinomycetota bacterium]